MDDACGRRLRLPLSSPPLGHPAEQPRAAPPPRDARGGRREAQRPNPKGRLTSELPRARGGGVCRRRRCKLAHWTQPVARTEPQDAAFTAPRDNRVHRALGRGGDRATPSHPPGAVCTARPDSPACTRPCHRRPRGSLDHAPAPEAPADPPAAPHPPPAADRRVTPTPTASQGHRCEAEGRVWGWEWVPQGRGRLGVGVSAPGQRAGPVLPSTGSAWGKVGGPGRGPREGRPGSGGKVTATSRDLCLGAS